VLFTPALFGAFFLNTLVRWAAILGNDPAIEAELACLERRAALVGITASLILLTSIRAPLVRDRWAQSFSVNLHFVATGAALAGLGQQYLVFGAARPATVNSLTFRWETFIGVAAVDIFDSSVRAPLLCDWWAHIAFACFTAISIYDSSMRAPLLCGWGALKAFTCVTAVSIFDSSVLAQLLCDWWALKAFTCVTAMIIFDSSVRTLLKCDWWALHFGAAWAALAGLGHRYLVVGAERPAAGQSLTFLWCGVAWLFCRQGVTDSNEREEDEESRHP
jgi:hypothetical protein